MISVQKQKELGVKTSALALGELKNVSEEAQCGSREEAEHRSKAEDYLTAKVTTDRPKSEVEHGSMKYVGSKAQVADHRSKVEAEHAESMKRLWASACNS